MNAAHARTIERDLSQPHDDLRCVVYGLDIDDQQDEDSIFDYTVRTSAVSLPPTHEIVAACIGGRRIS